MQYPNLCFDGSKDDGSTDEDIIKIERANFINTVNSIISKHNGTRVNKFTIRYTVRNNRPYHLDRWILFATASKAKIIDMNLWPDGNSVRPRKYVYRFPLETLNPQDGPFIESLFLTNVSIEPHSDMCGFTKLRRFHLHRVQIIGDLSSLLSNCGILEDLEVVSCSGVAELNIPHQLDKLRRLLISYTDVQMVDFHVSGLTHFGYQGAMIPIVLRGCPKLEASFEFGKVLFNTNINEILVYPFSGIPSISAVKALKINANISDLFGHVWSFQVHSDKTCTLICELRHLTFEITLNVMHPNEHNGLLSLAQYLDFAPQLETLQLNMVFHVSRGSCWHGEELSSHTHRLDHLKTVYMSGFQCYQPQVELLCDILQNGAALEQVTIDPIVTLKAHDFYSTTSMNRNIPEDEICEWARRASERFGKAITVVKSSSPLEK